MGVRWGGGEGKAEDEGMGERLGEGGSEGEEGMKAEGWGEWEGILFELLGRGAFFERHL